MFKVSLLSVCNFPKVELLACYITAQSIWYCIFPADGIVFSHNWWLWLQVCGNTTKQTGVSDLSGCGSQSTPSDMLWKGLLQSLPGWTQETLHHLPKLQTDGTKLPWHQRWVSLRQQSQRSLLCCCRAMTFTSTLYCGSVYTLVYGYLVVLHAWLA